MNTARLARLWGEAQGDPVRMAEALHDELAHEHTGYVQTDRLERALAELRNDLATFKVEIMRNMILAQVAGFLAVIVVILFRGSAL
jgi:hypothetical protein